MSKVHAIDFFFFLPDLDSARAVARRLDEEGFNAEIHQHADGGFEFTIEATKEFIPEVRATQNLTVVLGELASGVGGRYGRLGLRSR